MTGELLLIEDEKELRELSSRASGALAVAVDVEANGLFAFRARLCTVQIAFQDEGGIRIAIVDTMRAPVSLLSGVLGPAGPVKVLHDLSFDARLLAEAGVPLGNVRDTSVAARLLEYKGTGLGALLASELGIQVDKALQQHDWGKRPLLPVEVRYLAEDVRHLLALDERLSARAAALGIEGEIADECAYKLAAAHGPPRDRRPAYARVRGAAALDPVGRAILRRLAMAREAAAEKDDVPPFKVAGNDVLLEWARRRPATREALREVSGGGAGRAGALEEVWISAIEAGVRDGDVPEEERALFARGAGARVRAAALRREKEAQIAAWRRAEARARGVGEQVVLPGHCAQDLLDIAVAAAAEESPTLHAAIASIPGIGAVRMRRYGDALVALALSGPRATAT